MIRFAVRLTVLVAGCAESPDLEGRSGEVTLNNCIPSQWLVVGSLNQPFRAVGFTMVGWDDPLYCAT